ncbi:MAG: hypothetical protein GYA34_16060, partial [Chloroflexi bacterium]|nr:hypothetical protein [Chloroflexota bacterium]
AGWSPSLIPDESILNAFFQQEQAEIEALEERTAVLNAELSEALESVELEQEDEERENQSIPSPAEVKHAVKAQIAILKAMNSLKHQSNDVLEMELSLQRIETVEKVYKEAKKTTNSRKEKMEDQLEKRRKTLTQEETKDLVLEKLKGMIETELRRISKSKFAGDSSVFEKLWEKYHVSLHAISDERHINSDKLNVFLKALSYE